MQIDNFVFAQIVLCGKLGAIKLKKLNLKEFKMEGLSPDNLTQVATYFKALSEPNRLQILNCLRQDEHNLTELVQLTASSPANVSRHLAQLCSLGILERQSRGNNAFFKIADPAIYELCDFVCDCIARNIENQNKKQQAFLK